MQENILTIAVIILIGIFISELIANYQLYGLKKNIKKDSNLNESYFDLKLRLHSLQLTVAFATFLIVFLGWNIKEQIIDSITGDISAQIEPDVKLIRSKADSLKTNYDSLSLNLTKKIAEINQLSKYYLALRKDYENLNSLMNLKLEHLSTLLNIYLVTNLELDPSKRSTKLFFKDLVPVNANKLPEFKTPPFINIQTDWGLGLNIDELTNSYIVISSVKGVIVDDTFKFGKLTLWIIPKN